jgi:transcriptional regulator with XRE-family HTH domain
MNTLKDLRKTLKLKQSDFAAKIGMAQTSYSQIETGLIDLTEKNVKLICYVFGVNEVWLRTGAGPVFESSPGEDEKRLLDLFNKLTPSGKRLLLDYAGKYLAHEKDLLTAAGLLPREDPKN